jgi:hypothetical protein
MKRGSIDKQTFFAFELLIGIAVAAILIYTATHINEFSNVDVIYAENDLDLLTSTILSCPGEITYNYELSGKFEVESVSPFDINKNLISKEENKILTLSLIEEEEKKTLYIT